LDSLKYRTTRDVVDAIDSIDKDQVLSRDIIAWRNDYIDRVIVICQDHHTPMMILGYPSCDLGYRQLALERQVPYVENKIVFDELLKNKPLAVLFSPEGHCNANGYRVMAENVCNVILANKLIEK
jgi:hypothetical protein